MCSRYYRYVLAFALQVFSRPRRLICIIKYRATCSLLPKEAAMYADVGCLYGVSGCLDFFFASPLRWGIMDGEHWQSQRTSHPVRIE